MKQISPVLSMSRCKCKLDEENAKHASWLRKMVSIQCVHSSLRLVRPQQTVTTTTAREACNKYDQIAASLFLMIGPGGLLLLLLVFHLFAVPILDLWVDWNKQITYFGCEKSFL